MRPVNSVSFNNLPVSNVISFGHSMSVVINIIAIIQGDPSV